MDFFEPDMHFIVFMPMNYEICINGKLFSSEERFISGKTIRKMGNIPSGHLISFRINNTNKHVELEDGDTVDLGHPATEHFYSGPKEAATVY